MVGGSGFALDYRRVAGSCTGDENCGGNNGQGICNMFGDCACTAGWHGVRCGSGNCLLDSGKHTGVKGFLASQVPDRVFIIPTCVCLVRSTTLQSAGCNLVL